MDESPSIAAYDLPERVLAYDADMDVMHPNRSKMVEVVLEVLPFPGDASLTAIDLGVGTGFLTSRFLTKFQAAGVIAVEGAPSMVGLAKTRLGTLAERVTFVVGDFRRLAELLAGTGPADVVFSSFALHHLNAGEKRDVIRYALSFLRPGGWFLNADIFVSESKELEARIQELRVQGVVARAAGRDGRFKDAPSTRCFLDDLEAREGDQPLPLARDLEIARQAGLTEVEVFWKEYREAVFGGPK